MSGGRRASFVVRAVRDRRGRLTGVIERVATGAKEAFTGMETIGTVIARMLERGERPGKRAR
jgi:hypothetical protein